MKFIVTLSLILAAQTVLAHGEDKLGPNGGYVRMPGAFHTEVVPAGKNKIKVYLLDIQFKNPSVRRGKVEVTYKGDTSVKARCNIKNNLFQCSFPENIDLTKKGLLLVNAQREEKKGSEVTYPLPFKLEGVKSDDSSAHSGH